MRAIGNWIVIEDITPSIRKTSGGLEFSEKADDEVRYKKGIVISSGSEILNEGDSVIYDKHSGHYLPGAQFKVIGLRDVVAVE